MRGGFKLIHGVGINDADYKISKNSVVGFTEEGKRIQKLDWICPFYLRWRGMLERSYSEKYHAKYPSYIGCHVTPEWHYFMTFRKWMVEQDWEGKELDKDLLVPGNKLYSPDTCVFLTGAVNTFLIYNSSLRGEWPVGVNYDKNSGKFRAQGNLVVEKKRKSLGYYEKVEDAHQAYLTFKFEQAKILASQQTDPRVAKALIERYENYGND